VIHLPPNDPPDVMADLGLDICDNSVKLQACRDAAHAANKAKLEAERTVAPKIAFT